MHLPIKNGLLFVHMPKTAGTSFREALERSLGVENMYYDYGTGSSVSTELILQHTHPVRHLFELAGILAKNPRQFCLAGHFSLPKYAPLFLMRNTIMFLRDPVQRFISSYEHHLRFNGMDMSLEAYCQDAQYLNVQSRVLGAFPIETVGFVGFQEHYAEALDMIRDLHDIADIEEVVTNVFDGRVSKAYRYPLDDEMLALVSKANAREMGVYQRAEFLYQQRKALFTKRLPYTHGLVVKLEQKKISGWAANLSSDQPVEVAVLRNGELEGQAVARAYRSGLRERNVGRHGYVGFDFELRNRLAEDDVVTCEVVGTGQLLSGPQSL